MEAASVRNRNHHLKSPLLLLLPPSHLPDLRACAKLETGAYDGIPGYMCRYTKELLHLYSADLAASRA